MRITVNVAEDRLAILCALICVVEATTTIEISSVKNGETIPNCAKSQKSILKPNKVNLPIRQLPERLRRILHQIRSGTFPHAETHEHRNDEVVALLVAYEYESFRDVVREFGEAFYGFRTRSIEAGDVDREVTLEVGDVEREWVCAVALCAGICCEMRRGG